MRPSVRRLATSISSTPLSLSESSATVLPPIPLYRRLLRVHRKALPPEMRVMGDGYVKDEFRRCRNIEDPLQIIGFLSQWKVYLDGLESPEEPGKIGKRLDPEMIEKMSPEQLGQLYELLQATKEVWVEPGEAGGEGVSMGAAGGEDQAEVVIGPEGVVVKGTGRSGGGSGER